MRDPTFTAINYSLRPSKTIQRGLVFEGLRRLQEHLDWRHASYVGFGSIWFTDFLIAHKILRLSHMVSIEANQIGYRRAKFNRPYSFVRVRYGYSYDVLPPLFQQVRFQKYPSIIWLDYDQEIGEGIIDELRNIAEIATPDSVLITTFDASEKHYGADPDQILIRLEELFGYNATHRLTKADVRGIKLAQTLATLTSRLLSNATRRISKLNPCIPAFQVVYKDKASMVTVGATFPRPENVKSVAKCVSAADWPGFVAEPVIAPHLTSKEVSVLQSKLPAAKNMSRSLIQELGFDLEDDQIQAFRNFYRHYPTFAQIIS